ncbi:MAG TPA: ABC transporter permease [Phycisphaerae bacterium]|nr:ABC transporter permease [Phycisphaerae bacterium]
MRGLWQHFRLTLMLNWRSRQALIYGYLVPVFFLIAFGSIFRSGKPVLINQLGQLLTISILGGACFGMPTAMVAERERGIWRRYRLLPARTGSLVLSVMGARYLIILSAAVMQIFLAALMYGMPLPRFPGELWAAFSVVVFAFLGLGLVIAMLAENVPAVQALGQAIFLPMIMIGGVGVPLAALPGWAQHFAAFLPGRYAVEALDAAVKGRLGAAGFDVAALLAIGAAGCVAGAGMFRWDAQERGGRRGWLLVALAGWAAVGLVAEGRGRTGVGAAGIGVIEEYVTVTQAQIDAVSYDDLPEDYLTTTPVAADFSNLDAEGQARIAELRRELEAWGPVKVASPTERVRNLLNAAAVADLNRDVYEGPFALLVFQKLERDFPKQELEKLLVWVIAQPAGEKVIVALPELQIPDEVESKDVPERVRMYAKKLLGRLTGKRPASGAGTK